MPNDPTHPLQLTAWTHTKYPGTQPSATPIVAIHGFMGHASDWKEVHQHLPTRTLYALHIPGVIRDHSPEYIHRKLTTHKLPKSSGIARAAKRLIAHIQALPEPHIHLVGYSLGARIALCTALEASSTIQSLTLLAGHPGIQDLEERRARMHWDLQNALQLRTNGTRTFVSSWLQHNVFSSLRRKPSVRQRLIEQRSAFAPIPLAQQVIAYSPGRMMSMWHQLPELHPPLCYLAGAEDPKYQKVGRKLTTTCPHAQFRLIQHAGHHLLAEAPASVAAELARFFERIEST